MLPKDELSSNAHGIVVNLEINLIPANGHGTVS